MAALIEKLTNAIDAVLMRKCFEAGIDPKSKQAPTSMHEAVGKWFARNLWDNRNALAEQALDIQLVPSGPRGRTSLVVYDNGEGQEPDDFPQTFLSLRNSNKKDIPFVQGMYNMGGTAAIVFCGHKKYQLIGSRRHDGTGYFGFTLIRRHPLSNKEESSKKDVWYEYFVHEGKIPRFPLTLPMDLHLQGREFEKGTVIKLYSYQLPKGVSSNIAQGLFQSISELLIEPALPIWVAESGARYDKTKVLTRPLEGVRRSLAKKAEKLAERQLPFKRKGHFGEIQVDCYVFKAISGDKSVNRLIQRHLKALAAS